MKIAPFVFMLFTCSILEDDRITKLASENTSNVDRDALVERLKRSEVSTTAAPILGLIRDYASPSEPGMSPQPWMDDSLSHRAKVWYASHAVWDGLFHGKSDPAKTRILLKLLHHHQDSYSRGVVLEQLRRHWTDGAEAQVASLLKAKETSDSTKLDALRVLLEQVGEKYVSHALHFIQAAPSEDKRNRYLRVFNVGDRFFKYSRKNRDEIVALGFAILEADATPGTPKGYFLARQLGYFLQVPRKFSPDQGDPQYQGSSGLHEIFFGDTVTNAIEWRRKNRRGNVAPP